VENDKPRGRENVHDVDFVMDNRHVDCLWISGVVIIGKLQTVKIYSSQKQL
jgi:hypothetical protein